VIFNRVLFLACLTVVTSFCVSGSDVPPAASAGGEECAYTKEQLFCGDEEDTDDPVTPEDLKILETLNRHSQVGEVDRNRLFVRLEIKFRKSDESLESIFIPLGFFISGWQDYSTKTKTEKVTKKHMLSAAESVESFVGGQTESAKDIFSKSLRQLVEVNFTHDGMLFTVPVLNVDGVTYPPRTLIGYYGYADHLSWKLHFMNLLSILSCEPGQFVFSDIRRKVPDSNVQPFIEDCYIRMQQMYQKTIDSFQIGKKATSHASLSMDEYMKKWDELSKEECFSSSGFYKSFGCSEQAFLSFLGQKEFSEDVRKKIAEICSSAGTGTVIEINLHLASTYNMCPYCTFTFDTMLKNGYLQEALKRLFDTTYLYSEPTELVEQKSKKQKKKTVEPVSTPSMELEEKPTPKVKTIYLDVSVKHKVFFTYLKKIKRGES